MTARPRSSRVGSVLVASDADVVRATLDRPEARNAIDESIVEGLDHAVGVALDVGARVLVVRGANATFSAGADLRRISELRHDPARLDEFIGRLGDTLDRIEAAPFASIAVVEGHAVAGGCELMLACDIVVASTAARIGDRHLEYGVVPGAGGSVRLSRTLPAAVARYLLLTGAMIDSQRAVELGLVSVAVGPDELDDAVDELVTRLATRSRDALAVTKQMTVAARTLSYADALANERRLCVDHIAHSADVDEGLDAFVNRRAPRFR